MPKNLKLASPQNRLQNCLRKGTLSSGSPNHSSVIQNNKAISTAQSDYYTVVLHGNKLTVPHCLL